MADRLQPGSPVAQPALLGLMLLLAAASTAGLPPLPGFIGKLMLLQAASLHPWAVAVWVVILTAGFFTLVGLARAGSIQFWAVREDAPSGASGASFKLGGATLALLLASVLMSVFAAPLLRYTAAAAEQLLDRDASGRAVLGEQGGASADTARPFSGSREAP
jgi:multicomponent K+:H+ antiporter subunit D